MADPLPPLPLDEPAIRRLRRLQRLHHAVGSIFIISMILLVAGIGLAMATGVEQCLYVSLAGFALGAIVVAMAMFVYPFLKCPRCGERFFLPKGWLAHISRVDPLQKACRNCGQEFPPRNPAT